MVKLIKNPFILIDGSAYLHRAYHAFPKKTGKSDQPNGAVYGVLKMIKNLLMQYRPSHAALVLDAKGKNFRHQLFKLYKAHRPPLPEDLKIQINPLCKCVKEIGLPIISVIGVEADDVIGTLSQEAERSGYHVMISTNDKDMVQLVTPSVSLINTMKQSILGPEEVKMQYGFSPHQIIDFLALMGDKSDNIPGVPGIGKKIARILIQNIGGLDLLYLQLKKITSLKFRGAKQIGEKLKKYEKTARLSFQLATIKKNVKLSLHCQELKLKPSVLKNTLHLLKSFSEL